MILFPAIDLKDGQCVRLEQGEMDRATVFNGYPASQAISFEKSGFKWLHLVDLNGAFAGHSMNSEAILSIIKAVSMPIQLGGGIRDHAAIDFWLDAGIRRVILGTAALRNPSLVREACKRYPGRIVVGIDARNFMVAVEGWAETAQIDAIELAKQFEDAGVSALIFTDIDRDGVLKGLNLSATLKLAEAVTIPVIASGGLASMNDIELLMQPQYNMLEGAISGRALYDGRLDPLEALARMTS